MLHGHYTSLGLQFFSREIDFPYLDKVTDFLDMIIFVQGLKIVILTDSNINIKNLSYLGEHDC